MSRKQAGLADEPVGIHGCGSLDRRWGRDLDYIWCVGYSGDGYGLDQRAHRNWSPSLEIIWRKAEYPILVGEARLAVTK